MILTWIRVGTKAIVVAGLGLAALWSVRVGCADYWMQRDNVAGVERSIAAAPGQAESHYRLALLLSDDDPQRSEGELQSTVALNPLDARAWIELGLRSETKGDYPAAEQYLLRAANSDQKYLPRWTLANYYFRRRNTAAFWLWAKASAQMLYGDPSPLFRLCDRVEEVDLIDRLSLRKPDLWAGYLDYSLAEGRTGSIVPIAQRFTEKRLASDVPLLLSACDRLLDMKHDSEALDVWNRLCDARMLPFSRLNPARGPVLTNGNFVVAPTSNGFDWRLPHWEGVTVAGETQSSGLRLSFSGREPVNLEALFQFVPVEERASYEMRFRYRTVGIPPGSGLAWRITAGCTGAKLGQGESLSSSEEREGRLAFQNIFGCRLARLALVYERPPGMTRIDGFIVLRALTLERNDQSPASLLRVMK